MDLEYDQKLEEMKNYIPFLESMIKRLDSTGDGFNPRQAQLNKIRSLRELLMDKKKRMKMDNLLKCEQVLLNLYAKVEQRDALPGPQSDDSSKIEQDDLISVRSKLKSVVSKLQTVSFETLPEIARASETEEVCVPGSKEPALFQRRPTVPPPPIISTPLRSSPSKNKESPIAKRTYTRILLSPKHSETYWSNDTSSDQPLFSRRSPKTSPRKRSPSYHKKERKKLLKNKLKYNQSKDLNITLNVPEDSLNSLNTKDILSRIINCSDSDVDIATLRELRTQILGELKDTGAKDDISDIILKSYKNKKNKKSKGARSTNFDVEEGELSESESEAIDSISGSLVVLDKNKSFCTGNKSSNIPRKIQICLVINSDKTKPTTQEAKISCDDTSDLETFKNQNDQKNNKLENTTLTSILNNDNLSDVSDDLLFNDLILDQSNTDLEIEINNSEIRKDKHKIDKTNIESSNIEKNVDVIKPNFYKPLVEVDQDDKLNNSKNSKQSPKLENDSLQETSSKKSLAKIDEIDDNSEVIIPLLEPTIPILEPSEEVSEIDILQALKKEILSETTNVLNSDTAVPALSTPLLHQPKIAKVVNAKEIGPKKRISIESYKAKAHSSRPSRTTVRDDISRKQSLKLTEKECERFNILSKMILTESSDDDDRSSLAMDDTYTDFAPKSPDHEDFADTGLKPPVIIPSDPVQAVAIGSETDVDMRKILPNLKSNDSSITPFLSLSTTNSSEKEISKSDENVAPFADLRINRDVTPVTNQDTFNSQLANVEKIHSPLPNFVTSISVVHNINVDQQHGLNVNSNTTSNSMMSTSAQSLNMTPSVALNMAPNILPLLPLLNMTPNRTPNTAPNMTPTVTPKIPLLMTPNRTPNTAPNMTPPINPKIPLLMTPSRTPNIANMTPNMTPSRHAFENEDYSCRKHVYAPMFSVVESRDAMDKSREDNQMQWDSFGKPKNSSLQRDIDYSIYRETQKDIDYRDQMSNSVQRDIDFRKSGHSVQRDNDYRDIRNSYVQSSHSFDQRDSDRIQFPTTPIHPFGRQDCPPTPMPSFGRLDCPPTPTPSFGRLDCPPTPTSSFGRVERPMTPVHPFSRLDCPLTPSHPTIPPLLGPNFGRSEYNQPSSRPQDPRLNRSSDYDSNQYRDDDWERGYFQERKHYSASYNNDYQSRDMFRKYRSEKNVDRNERNKNYESIPRPHKYRRDTSVSRSFDKEDRDYNRYFNRDYEDDRYSRNHSNSGRGHNYRYNNDSKNHDESNRRRQHDKSFRNMQEKVSNTIKDRKEHSNSEDKKLPVNTQAGLSFTIDTRINSSFQEISTRQSSSTFDARRQRASSVGRTLSSIKRTTNERETTLEIIHADNDTEKKIRNAHNFRRACSVGREIVDKKLDFKDIKADLKSFKLKSDFRFSKNKDDSSRVLTARPKNVEPLREQKVEVYETTNFNSKYSPRKNNRDPRMCRSNSRDSKDCKSSLRDSKNYGIVYSNDNISKGTILGSGYGVKNYKIPKIKRPQKIIEASKTTNDVEEENGTRLKNNFEASNSLHFKEHDTVLQGEIKEHKSENKLNEKNNMMCKKINPNDFHNFKNSDKRELENDQHKKQQGEIDEFIENNESKTSSSNKEKNYSRKSKNLQIKEELSDDDSNKNKKATKVSAVRSLNTSSDSSDNIERRITRSSRKTITEEPKPLELSPNKRTRNAKKSMPLDSDSDDNEKLMKPNEKSKISLFKSTKNEGSSKRIFSAERKIAIDEKAKELVQTESVSFVNNENKPISTVLETSEHEEESEIIISENTNTVKQEVQSSNKQVSVFINNILQETDIKRDDDLESSFCLGDLEMFSDNITSDPVVDSINALIEDLDHDLNSTNNTDANSHFTKELGLEVILEKLPSLDRNDKKVTANVSSHENDLNETDKANIKLNTAKTSMCSEYISNVAEHRDISQEDGGSTMKYSESQKREILNKSKSPGSEIEIKDSKTEMDSFDKESEISNLPSEQLVQINKVNTEDACSNVLTPEECNVFNSVEIPFNNVSNKKTIDISNKKSADISDKVTSTPDSTINSNVQVVERKSALLRTDDSGCKINSYITSTHVSDVVSKDAIEAVPTDVGTSKEMESIGKLLSILQDKTKIKELLSLFGGQSSNDEKLKKKLVKLSEIVSDDEFTSENNHEKESEVSTSSGKIDNDHSDKNINQTQKELKKVEIDYNVQDGQDKQTIESYCETLNSQKDNKEDTEKTSTQENTTTSTSSTNSVNIENSQIIALNNSDEIPNDFNKKDTEKTITQENPSSTNSVNSENSQIIALNNNDEIPNDFNKISSENITTQNDVQELGKTDITEPKNCKDVENKPQCITTEGDIPVSIKKKIRRRRRGKKQNRKKIQTTTEDKLLTRSDAIILEPMVFDKPVTKKPSRELQKLREDIKEMFLKDDILSAPGIRMCRIAKLVDERKTNVDSSPYENNIQEPLVVTNVEKIPKKKTIKSKKKGMDNNSICKSLNANKTETVLELDPNPNIKERKHRSLDPYVFETDSVNDLNDASDNRNDSNSESDSVNSTKSSESIELSETKKRVKRKRGRLWQAGVIKPKHKKKKFNLKSVPSTSTDDVSESETRKVPDYTCFTDRTYCFRKHILTYNCRICLYSGTDIVHHYKKEHPHTEVPLSRLCPVVAKDAMKESEDINFQEISKISSKKYICRFCFKEFSRKKLLLEAFFWHVVSMHTGEYKQTCSKCVDNQICPLDIDIPPPPKDANGQLLGYICEKCNYTQISLENLKTHVIVWHNDEQTAVYTINLASLSKSAIDSLLNRSELLGVDSEQPRVLRSSRSNNRMAEASDDESDSTEDNYENLKRKLDEKDDVPVVEVITKTSHILSKITFESDIMDEISNFDTIGTTVKTESDSNEIQEDWSEPEKKADEIENKDTEKPNESRVLQDIFDYPHFKTMHTKSRSKLYVCCINGNDYHYKTPLLISMKKHVQLNHTEKWDGYCCLCKVIVTPQGEHKFRDCFQHFLDMHIDSFPILEEIPVTKDQILVKQVQSPVTQEKLPVIQDQLPVIQNQLPVTQEQSPETNEPTFIEGVPEKVVTNKSYINVRPLSDLMSNLSKPQPTDDSGPVLPVIESVVSLVAKVDQPRPSPTSRTENVGTLKQYNYEKFQAVIMSRKHSVVLESMMSQTKLVQVFKCAGRFCSFTTNNAEDALLHASTHMRVGGVDSLNCVYCDFDSSGNAIDLITHVFKYHGCCPYICSICFYRAAASQLVNAHIKRVHENVTNAEILKTSFQTAPLPEDNILSRDAAVCHYFCCDKSSPDDTCKFKTYTREKFIEHFQSRHPYSTEFICSICSTSVPTPAELVCHLKTHDIKLYQCAWCVFGADDETELLEHASDLHPTRQPKAYLRIITKQPGTAELRVLPLAYLNKSDLPAVHVAMTTQKEFPVREAERSVELEKLIGHTNFMIDNMSTTSETGVSESDHSTQIGTAVQAEEPLSENINILENTETLLPRTVTPPPAMPIDQSEQSTPIIKAVILDLTPEKIPQQLPEIVCLDSDDESPPSNIATLPNLQKASKAQNLQVTTEVEVELKKVKLNKLFVCSKCKLLTKSSAGFGRHIASCFPKCCLIPCFHCPMSIPKKNIVSHYNSHCYKPPRHTCKKCLIEFTSASEAEIHEKEHHDFVTTEGLSLPTSSYNMATVPKKTRKRNSQNKDKAIEPPEKVKRYGPQDIDKLPINPILDDSVVCSLCEFSTKVRLNMVRHLQKHAQQQPVPQTEPVNPVPHLATNEKHFDKMVNLASSSIGPRQADKSNKSGANSSSLTPEAMSHYPKYVSDKERLTCGAKDCTYISVDEDMFKCHWDTLHRGANDYRCPHCPPSQHVKSHCVSAARIISHLKMHDERLYGCPMCVYYHYRLDVLDVHMNDIHKKTKEAKVIREPITKESTTSTAVDASLLRPLSARTMDLKPWQCGLCQFKHLLRPEVVDHCAKVHNSKMQFKCAYCAFRTYNPENIAKHQLKSHAGKPEDIFYYYYREGSVPDDINGVARWQKQSQNTVMSEPTVKSEDPSDIPPASPQDILPFLQPATPAVNLNLVKKELEPFQGTIEDLCRELGEFCEPNGLRYKCPLCNNVVEDCIDAMQSHLYEELKYRKWGCSICSYKAFHIEGLGEHMQTEHRQYRDPVALPLDTRIETWVAKLLEHQTSLICKAKENLAKQKEEILRNTASSTSKSVPPPATESSSKKSSTVSNIPNEEELEQMFGPFGVAANSKFCCPKCESSFTEEDSMHTHLESELNKIRWYCSNCSMKFTTYHEAQFHSRSVHIGLGARPVEVTKDAATRAAWVKAAIKTQQQSMDLGCGQTGTVDTFHRLEDLSDPAENSLLVVRYEKRARTPNKEVARRSRRSSTFDSDDERLVIDEPLERRTPKPVELCPHCDYTSVKEKTLRTHVLRSHYGLRPFTCPYCQLNGTRKTLEKHLKLVHPTQPIHLVPTEIPSQLPGEYGIGIGNASDPTVDAVSSKLVCLVCRNCFTEAESLTHTHDKTPTSFGKKGNVVVQCNVCFTLHRNVNVYLKHHKLVHPELGVNYVFSKLNTLAVESKEMLYACASCPQKFSQMKDIKTHADANHQSMLKYTLVSKHHNLAPIDDESDDEVQSGPKRKSVDHSILPPLKRTARKSTAKSSPISARKSTTKLPSDVPCDTQERSCYGSKPSNEGLEKVVTIMPFYNKILPVTLNKLKDIVNINPVVKVNKIANVSPVSSD